MEIMRVIANNTVYPVYQPIVDTTDGEVYAYEAFMRCPRGTPLAEIFAAAADCGLIRDLDILCVRNAMDRAPTDKPLFINVLPLTLIWLMISGQITDVLDRASQPVVFEIVETEQVSPSIADLSLAVQIIRSRGFKIAIDDISQGFSRLHTISALRPDYIKIDRTLCADNSKHYEVIKKSIISMAHGIGSKVIAEGIETECEHIGLRALGINLFQGYYFAGPGENYNQEGRRLNAQSWA